MSIQDFKPDLVSAGCFHLEIGFYLPPIEQVQAEIIEHFSGISAVATYSRRRSTHICFLAYRRDSNGGTEFKCRWFLVHEEQPRLRLRGDPWAALELSFNSIENLDIRCAFATENDVVPILKVPASPLAQGVLPFNEILGYRVAQTDESGDLWSAIVDSTEDGDHYHVTVRVKRCPVRSVNNVRQALRYCCSIRDGLLISRTSQELPATADD